MFTTTSCLIIFNLLCDRAFNNNPDIIRSLLRGRDMLLFNMDGNVPRPIVPSPILTDPQIIQTIQLTR